MNLKSLTVILTIIFFAFGCGLTDKFKAASNANANVSAATPAPSAPATSTVSPEVKSDGSKNPLDELGTNFLAFGAGTLVASVTSEGKGSGESARHLIDEAQFDGWETLEGETQNQSVVLELPARTTFKAFAVDIPFYNQYENRQPVKDFSVEVSDVSPTDGFQTVVEGTAQKGERTDMPPQIFSVSREIPARWVRYTAKNLWGEGKQIYTKELRGYGTQEPRQPLANISGTYKVEYYDEIHLKQEGNSIIGCYNFLEGIVRGTIDGRNISLTGTENGEKKTFISLNMANDGKTFKSGWWDARFDKKGFDEMWLGEKTSDKIGNCKQLPNLDGTEDIAKSAIEKNLADTGRATLYGINFDFNSDVIKPESKPTLDKVVAIMKEKSDWKFSVEGHTDNVGGDAFNQTLSEKRAASVLKYLNDAGIDASRLSSKGFGLSKPVAGNDSEAGRAQNRRVELVKQ